MRPRKSKPSFPMEKPIIRDRKSMNIIQKVNKLFCSFDTKLLFITFFSENK
jgi:hypothetical protein